MNLQQELELEIKKSQQVLNNNNEWEERYLNYAKQITSNIEHISYVRKSFYEWSPLKLYINLSSAKNGSSTVSFDLRYLGQAVAELIFKDDTLIIDTTKYNTNNKMAFDCDIELVKVDWRSKEAKQFRSFFAKKAQFKNISNEEHRIESLLLTEFSKNKDKALSGIKSVKIAGARFPMPTPLGASSHNEVKYSKSRGGNVDILTRVGTGGKATHLCIMELKDENKRQETPKDALKQAITYTVFIRNLLRSKSGNLWWNIFGFSGEVPKKLVLYSACVMPSNINNDYSFSDMELNINGDIIELHYVYFKELNNKIIDIETSL